MQWSKDKIIHVLVDVEASASKTVFTEQINAALAGHRQLIEQLANSSTSPAMSESL